MHPDKSMKDSILAVLQHVRLLFSLQFFRVWTLAGWLTNLDRGDRCAAEKRQRSSRHRVAISRGGRRKGLVMSAEAH